MKQKTLLMGAAAVAGYYFFVHKPAEAAKARTLTLTATGLPGNLGYLPSRLPGSLGAVWQPPPGY